MEHDEYERTDTERASADAEDEGLSPEEELERTEAKRLRTEDDEEELP